jgi:hypothetical protein
VYPDELEELVEELVEELIEELVEELVEELIGELVEELVEELIGITFPFAIPIGCGYKLRSVLWSAVGLNKLPLLCTIKD